MCQENFSSPSLLVRFGFCVFIVCELALSLDLLQCIELPIFLTFLLTELHAS